MQSTLEVLRNLTEPIISAEDWGNLSLNSAPDSLSRVCRAWLLAGCRDHPDYDSSTALIARSASEPTGKFLKHAVAGEKINLKNGGNLWSLFCPTAEAASQDPEIMAHTLRERRRLSGITPSIRQLKDPTTELLLTANALVSLPLDPDFSSVPDKLRDEASHILGTPQSFWYDHPVPLDASLEENEILYGLRQLDEALKIECDMGHISSSAKIDLAISISVTHRGMEQLAADYVRNLVREHLRLKHLRVYLFDEIRCQQMIETLCPGNAAARSVFGVNGAYGRHYSFLKILLLFWQQSVNPNAAFTFKIDLDQVFDQKALLYYTGCTALQHLMNPNWGGRARDYVGREVELGMLAGGLVNQRDIKKGLFIPDVKRPNSFQTKKAFSSNRVFCPQWPQAISTEAEILQTGGGFQRIHVTGGTTGITDTALKRWRPFTPSFINRAEDQAYTLSAIEDTVYLSHLHANGLIMRHDKTSFAARSIAHAGPGKAIGNIERLMLFSHYAALQPLGFDRIRNHCWPFTSCFMHPQAKSLAALIFLIDGSLVGGRFVNEGAPRLLKCLEFCKTTMASRLKREKYGWNSIYEALSAKRYSKSNLTKLIVGTAVDHSV